MNRLNDWSGRDGSFWADHDDRYDVMLGPLTRHLLAAAAVQPEERVLDVGCGCGNTTRLAGRAASEGSALGVDLSTPMLAKARRRTEEAGLSNVTYELADAQTHPFERYDLVMSQLGVMFFDDPVTAFKNLRRTTGRLVFICWQGIEQNETRAVKRAALSPYLDLPQIQPGTGATSLADPGRVEEILTKAGYTAITLTDVREPLLIGRTVEEAVEFDLASPTTAAALTEAGPTAAEQAADSLRAAYSPFATPTGVLLGSAAWLVTAN